MAAADLSLHPLNIPADHGVRGSRGTASRSSPPQSLGHPDPTVRARCHPASRPLRADLTVSFKNDTCKHLLKPKIKYSSGPSHEQRMEFCLLNPKSHRGVYRMKKDRRGRTHIRTRGSVPHCVWPATCYVQAQGPNSHRPRNDRPVVEPPAGSGLAGGDLGGWPEVPARVTGNGAPPCLGTTPMHTHRGPCPAVAPTCGHPDSTLVSGCLKFILEQFFFSFHEGTAVPRLVPEYK